MATKKELDKSFDDLVKAAAKYVELRGGKVLVSGNIQVIKFPGDLTYNWTLGIRCTGNPPIGEPPNTGSQSDGLPAYPHSKGCNCSECSAVWEARNSARR